ncbi:MAG: endonuclease/exonuclease/phosphatase family protein [Armatimonadetes bacterium]|nr:endonuclease/exonuclease/phosphatase family protein [Armatimonadota bacterium]
MRISRLGSYLVPLLCAGATVALLEAKCGGASPPPAKNGLLRIASYNMEWMNEEISKGREANVRSVIRNVNPDILAMQEIQSRAALRRFLGPEWNIAIADDLEEDQELALAVRKPLRIIRHAVIFKSPHQDFAFPGRRDTLRALVRTGRGEEIEIYVVHLKSRGGPGGRKATDRQRMAAARLLLKEITGREQRNLIVLGDFNDTPDDASLNILESGNPRAIGKMSDSTGPFLLNLMQPLHAGDYVTQWASNRYRAFPSEPRITGARRENDRWRGRECRFPDDLGVAEALFDQILVSRKSAPAPGGKCPNLLWRRSSAGHAFGGHPQRLGQDTLRQSGLPSIGPSACLRGFQCSLMRLLSR